MPQSDIKIDISVTEMPHFRRLVRFVEDVERYADAEVDLGLKALVDGCRTDLLSEPEIDMPDRGTLCIGCVEMQDGVSSR